jgi:hypothetical protein
MRYTCGSVEVVDAGFYRDAAPLELDNLMAGYSTKIPLLRSSGTIGRVFTNIPV